MTFEFSEHGCTISIVSDKDRIEIARYNKNEDGLIANLSAIFLETKNAEKLASILLALSKNYNKTESCSVGDERYCLPDRQ